MNRILLFVLHLASAFCVASADTQLLSEAKDYQARQRLGAYERGTLTFEEISGSQNRTNLAAITNIVFYYQTHSNEVTLKMLLPISRCFMVMGKASEAASLATSYLNVFSNDCRAWDILYTARAYEGSYSKALEIGTNALAFGCQRNLPTIGSLALQEKRRDIVENLVIPRLLVLKNTEEDIEDKHEMLTFLVLYSVVTTNRDLYVSALQDVKARDLGSNVDLRDWINKGCKLFKAKETKSLCEQLGAN